jgi:methionyl-tRNA formyltransferase
MKIVYFGTPQFAADILAYLLEKANPSNPFEPPPFEIVAVVTKPDRPKGRSGHPIPPPVKLLAQQQAPHLPILQPEKASSDDFEKILKAFGADLFVVVAYGQILKQNILDLPKLDPINVHASLLPKYRGAAPIQRCLINGEEETGVSIMQMVLAMDAGDVLREIAMPIPESMNYGQLKQSLCQLGKIALFATLRDYAAGNIRPTPQVHDMATYAPKVELEDVQIHWKRNAVQVHNLIRGSSPHPGAWCEFEVKGQAKRLKVLSSRVVPPARILHAAPGEILVYDSSGFVVACNGSALELLDVQLEGKRVMPVQEFMRGYSSSQLKFIVS